MKRFALALALCLALLGVAFGADVNKNGFIAACNDTTHGVTLTPPGWAPPMQLPPETLCDEATYEDVRWIFLHETPIPRIWLTDTDPADGVFDAWSRY